MSDFDTVIDLIDTGKVWLFNDEKGFFRNMINGKYTVKFGDWQYENDDFGFALFVFKTLIDKGLNKAKEIVAETDE